MEAGATGDGAGGGGSGLRGELGRGSGRAGGAPATSGRQWVELGRGRGRAAAIELGGARAGGELGRARATSGGARGGEPELGRGGRAAASRSPGRRRRLRTAAAALVWNEQKTRNARTEKAVCSFFLARRQDLWRRARCHAGLPRQEARRHRRWRRAVLPRRHTLWRRAKGPKLHLNFF
jgi:hypothetical protein